MDGRFEAPCSDVLVREEPLEIRVEDHPIAVLMRTPGDDEALVRGFVVTEGIVKTRAEVASVRACSVAPRPEADGNVMQVRLRAGTRFDPARFRRQTFTGSSCGICGKATLDHALEVAEPLPPDDFVVRADVLADLVPTMRAAQEVFDMTGGLHAAAGFSVEGAPLVVMEDIGRHNAVDKVLGSLEAPPDILAVSGRLGFEIAQKALAARVRVLVSVSAPSSLAVELADRAGMTLIAFARGSRAVVYTHPERVGVEETSSCS